MKELLFILLPLIILNIDLSKFSINILLDYLHETGFYEVLTNVKNKLGNDIAIAVCKEYVQSNDCEDVVNNYIPDIDISTPSSKSKRVMRRQKELIQIVFEKENLAVLKQFYKEEDIKLKALNILKKV